ILLTFIVFNFIIFVVIKMYKKLAIGEAGIIIFLMVLLTEKAPLSAFLLVAGAVGILIIAVFIVIGVMHLVTSKNESY
ncbi:MAG: hypothetical protein PHF54_03295, partial [Candidatus Pacebacteria bacterium]|nr:hypothetical protein [Candidatus Paceibacterota bacterium]